MFILNLLFVFFITISQAITLSNNLTAYNLPEENYQYFYKIYSTYFSGYPLPITDYNKLVDIAEQCPLDGGKAVFEARALRNHIDRWNYDYIDLCEDNSEKSFLDFNDKSEPNIILFPNPNNGIFSISNKSDLNLDFKLFDLIGNEIHSDKIFENSIQELNFENLANGIYLYELYNYNNMIKAGKLIISK